MKKIGDFAASIERSKAKSVSASGGRGFALLTPRPGLCPWTPLGAPLQTPVIGSRSVRSPCPLCKILTTLLIVTHYVFTVQHVISYQVPDISALEQY